jgi:hypothetical protein
MGPQEQRPESGRDQRAGAANAVVELISRAELLYSTSSSRQETNMKRVENHSFETRRDFLKKVKDITPGTALLSTAVELAKAGSIHAQTRMTPDEALKKLMEGNKRFVTRRMVSDQQDLSILKQNTAEEQEPFAAILSCADSRAPVELISTRVSVMFS